MTQKLRAQFSRTSPYLERALRALNHRRPCILRTIEENSVIYDNMLAVRAHDVDADTVEVLFEQVEVVPV